jgi:hypothetical protein
MALTKEVKIDKIVINSKREFLVRNATIIKDGGKEIARVFSNEVITKNDSVTKKDNKIKKLANIFHSKKAAEEWVNGDC